MLLSLKPLLKPSYTNGFTVFRIYCALKAHFSGSFDITKYGIKTSVTKESYEKRKDKVLFERIARKLPANQCYDLMVLNFVGNPDCLSYELADAEAYVFYLKAIGKLETISKTYQSDLEYIFQLLKESGKDFKNLLKGSGHPVILQLLIQKKVSIETFLLLESFIPLITIIDKVYSDDLIWIHWRGIITAYNRLLSINNELAKKIFSQTKQSYVIHRK